MLGGYLSKAAISFTIFSVMAIAYLTARGQSSCCTSV